MASLFLPPISSPPPHRRFTTSHGGGGGGGGGYTAYFRGIASLCDRALLADAFSLLSHTELHSTFRTGPDVYAELLQCCVYARALLPGRQLHARVLKSGPHFADNRYVRTKLVIFYSKCGALDAAQSLFDRLQVQNVFSWSAMVGLYCKLGMNELALAKYCGMLKDGILPDNFVVPNALKACSALADASFGRGVHGYVLKLGFGLCVFVSSGLVDMYGKCGDVAGARKVFGGMLVKNSVAWNAMIVSCVQNGMDGEAIEVFLGMRVEGVEPTRVTVSSFLSASANLGAAVEGRQGHAVAVVSGLELDNILGSSLINFYAKVGAMRDAEVVFWKMAERDVVAWNLLVSGYVQDGQVELAIDGCRRMRAEGLRFDSVTLSSILSASADSYNLELGRQAHGYCVRNSLESDLVVSSNLVNIYGKCLRLDAARFIFDSTLERDQVMWNTMIASYAQAGLSGEALTMFYQMQLKGVPQNVVSWNSLLLGFMRNGQISEAENLLMQMEESGMHPNIVSWTTLISGFAHNGCLDKAVETFRQMQVVGYRPNAMSITSILSACAKLASLTYGKAVHGHVTRHAFHNSISVVTSLIDMYAKCGDISTSEKIFEGVLEKEPVLYNTMMSGYASHGLAVKTLTLFQQMQKEGVRPDDITFSAVLSACAYTGMVYEGLNVFNKMLTQYNLRPNEEHYGCVVRLLSGDGKINDSLELVAEMPMEPDAPILGSLLASCRQHNNIELGEVLLERLSNLEPRNLGNYVTLSNTYAAAGKWRDVKEVREKMRSKGRKNPGCSWIQVGNYVHTFVAGDKSHPQTDLIYDTLRRLEMDMKSLGCSCACC